MAVPLEVIQGGAEEGFYYTVSQMKTPELLEKLDTILCGCEKNFRMHNGCLVLEYSDVPAVRQLEDAHILLNVAGVRHQVYPWGLEVELYGNELRFVGV